MHGCREFEDLIDREHAGEPLAAAERDRLADHLESCRACDELCDLVGALGDPAADEPSEAELAAVRRRVRAALKRPRALPFRSRPYGGPRFWLAAAAVGGLAAGWLLAGALATPATPAAPDDGFGAPLAASAIAGELRRAAARHASFAQAADAPYLFRDVRLAPLDERRVHLAFDVSRHLELELDRDDPLLAEVLVQAMLENDSIGSRLAAIEAAPADVNAKVRRALVVAMRHDPNLAVRLRAQQRLAALVGDEAIVTAMLEVLAGEESVEMRFAAVDYLAGGGVAPERVLDAIRQGDRPGERAVLLRARGLVESDNGEGGAS
jgi:hypothetical protein